MYGQLWIILEHFRGGGGIHWIEKKNGSKFDYTDQKLSISYKKITISLSTRIYNSGIIPRRKI